MAARKSKTQGKKIDEKIKSNNRKKRLRVKKRNICEKPLSKLKWLGDVSNKGTIKTCGTIPDWFTNSPYERRMSAKASAINSDYEYQSHDHIQDREQDDAQVEEHDHEHRSVSSEASECNCSYSKYPEDKSDIRKSKTSSSNSLVSKYIKLGMNQVASFIVESAIRFGEEHGVVVPDKDTPNLYEITPPDGKLAEKFRKIRFKTPKQFQGAYDEGSKISIWKKNDKTDSSSVVDTGNTNRRSSSWTSAPDSLDEILPILEKLKKGGDVESDLDLEKFRQPVLAESSHKREKERERNRERCRMDEREKERLKKKWLKLRKSFQNKLAACGKEGKDYKTEERSRWKKCRRNSVDILRQRGKTPSS